MVERKYVKHMAEPGRVRDDTPPAPPSEPEDILEKLDKYTQPGRYSANNAILSIEAKAEIERLRGRVAELEARLAPNTEPGEWVSTKDIDRMQAAEARVKELIGALCKISELRFAEDTNEPFDDALDIADRAVAPRVIDMTDRGGE